MNTLIKKVLPSSALLACLFATSISHADVKSMTQMYNNPQSAPKVQRCKSNQNCNAFYALSKQWQSIPENFKISGMKLKPYAKSGDGYGLWKGFTLNSSRAIALSDAGDAVFYSGGSSSAADERIFAQGLAVLLYLENKK